MSNRLKIFLLLLSLLSHSLFANDPKIIWSKIYTDTGFINEAVGIQVINNEEGTTNGFIIVGNTDSWNNTKHERNFKSKVVIFRTNNSGDTTMMKLYGGSKNEKVAALTKTLDNKYVMVGKINKDANSLPDFFAIKFDAAGTFMWEKTIPIEGNVNPKGICTDTEGNILLVGDVNRMTSDSITDYDYCVVKLDNKSGETIWSKIYEKSNFQLAREIIKAADSSLIIVGTEWVGLNRNPELVKINANGEIAWEKTFNDVENMFFGDAGSATLFNDGNIAFLATIAYNDSGNGDDYTLFRVNSQTGEALWTKRFPKPGMNLAKKIRKLDNGSFLLFGETWGDEKHSDVPQRLIEITHVSPSGNEYTRKSIGVYHYDICNEILLLPNNDIIITGSGGLSISNRKISLLKVSFPTPVNLYKFDALQSSNLGCITHNSIVKNYLPLQFQLQQNSYITVFIHDLSGKLILRYSENTKSGSYYRTLNTQHIANGRYFLSVYINNKRALSYKFSIIK